MYTNKNDGRKLNTYLEVKKLSIQLDWKLQFRFDQFGHSSNTLFLVKYAKDKTISVLLYLNTAPPTPSHISTLTYIESRLNITIPSFNSLILEGRVYEMVPNEYDVCISIFRGCY